MPKKKTKVAVATTEDTEELGKVLQVHALVDDQQAADKWVRESGESNQVYVYLREVNRKRKTVKTSTSLEEI